MDRISIIGGGLAGCEAAWQAANRGMKVTLFEMRPHVQTGAHKTDKLGELICSNSLGSNLPDRATGQLLYELRRLNSLLIKIADSTSVPAGGALAVDRELFSEKISQALVGHPNIQIIRQEVRSIPEGISIITSGPLTSPPLMDSISKFVGSDALFFYDAIAPIISRDSIDMSIAFRASRYERGQDAEGDYLNCPFTESEYDRFIQELTRAERIQLQNFEKDIENGVRAGSGFFFERCLPVEVLANRERMAMAYGPMRPVGLQNPHSENRPFAVIQLRQDDLADSLYNMVGFQTNLTYGEQKRVFRMIPGLENAEFIRYGQMHRNSFLCSPKFLSKALNHRQEPRLFFAGQLIGVEGYAGNIATGLLAGINAARYAKGADAIVLPSATMLGALIEYITHANPDNFQPMKANLGLLPQVIRTRGVTKKDRHTRVTSQARTQIDGFIQNLDEFGEVSE
jgi:methylenetetrahydrofolate--tRNA-(uracil-5-)-methyltransferase